jgi:glutamate-1-semialdehyde 2,1-aminomutase
LGVPRELTGTAVGFVYNDLASFEAALEKLEGRVGVVVMEPMRSCEPAPGYLEAIAARCREIGAVLVFDEVTSGWRFGFPGAWKYLGVEPDIAVYAKATTNGFPGAAIIGRAEIMDAAKTSFISSTYWTDGIAPAAALTCVRKMRDQKVQPAIWALGQKLQVELQKLIETYPECRLVLSGMPAVPVLTFDLGDDSLYARILMIRKMAARGFLVSGPFFLMFAHDEAVIQSMLSALDETLSEIEVLVQSGRVREETGEVRAREGFKRLV